MNRMKFRDIFCAAVFLFASFTCRGKGQEEMNSVYRENGYSDPQIELIKSVIEPGAAEFHKHAKYESNLNFKGLRVGAAFPVKSKTNASGNMVRQWTFSKPMSSDTHPAPLAGPLDEWECWSSIGNIYDNCFLVTGAQLATAFEQKLKMVRVILTRPAQGFDPLNDNTFMGISPIILEIALITEDLNSADAESFVKAAVSYFSKIYGQSPKVSRDGQRPNIGPTEEQCAAVNAKKINALNTNELRVKNACASAMNSLLSILAFKRSSYEFNSPRGMSMVEVVTSSAAISNSNDKPPASIAVSMHHPQFSVAEERVKATLDAAVAAGARRKAAAATSDF